MPFPKHNEIEVPILIAVEAAGGELRPTRVLFEDLATYFPELTPEDLRAINRSGVNTWENKVHWARLRLVHRGELDRSRYGVWRITEKGRERIRREVGDVAKARERRESPHAQLSRKIVEIGTVLGKYARRELHEGPYTYDAIWKDAESAPRVTHAFEVQDKGNVLEALVRLKHAYDNWGSRLFLVVTGERDRSRVRRLLAPYFAGAFHEIGAATALLSPEEVDELHSTLTRHREVFGRFVAR